jgi:Zn-dependent protease
VVLWPLGGLTIYGPEDKGPVGDLKVAIAGPLSHLPLVAISAIIFTLIKEDGMTGLEKSSFSVGELEKGLIYVLATICRVAFWWNIMLISIHFLLPIYPLDGVRIWAGAMRSMRVSLVKSALIISVTGLTLSIGLFSYGCVMLFKGTLTSGVGVAELLLGGFGAISSKILYDLFSQGRLKEDPVFGREWYANSCDPVQELATDHNSDRSSTTPIENTESPGIV